MKRIIHILCLSLLIGAGQAHAEDQVMGWQKFKVKDAQKDRPIKESVG